MPDRVPLTPCRRELGERQVPNIKYHGTFQGPVLDPNVIRSPCNLQSRLHTVDPFGPVRESSPRIRTTRSFLPILPTADVHDRTLEGLLYGQTKRGTGVTGRIVDRVSPVVTQSSSPPLLSDRGYSRHSFPSGPSRPSRPQGRRTLR